MRVAIGLLGQIRCLPGGEVVLPEALTVDLVCLFHGILLSCDVTGDTLRQVVNKRQVLIPGRLHLPQLLRFVGIAVFDHVRK